MRDEAKIKSIQKETKNIFPLKIFYAFVNWISFYWWHNASTIYLSSLK